MIKHILNSIISITLMILFTQCNSVQISTQDKNNKTDLVTAHNNLPKNESSTYHTFKAAFKGIKYNKCMGRTAMCPIDCGNSGNFATFKILKYEKLEGDGLTRREQLKKYTIKTSDYYKNSFDDPNTKFIDKLKLNDEVDIEVVFIYDTTIPIVRTIEKIISIKKSH
ncbi:hypothetical protein [Patiriisocius sp. Uisw_017]|uniref:hypothetical protein n=1 Tax=Patiriisocius sp. Uisw_017 TaxID=3230968 RepID=UPI0039E75E79